MTRVVLALSLLAYNNLVNLWPAFHRWAYLPVNLAAAAGLIVLAGNPLGLSFTELGIRKPETVFIGAALGIAAASPLYVLLHTTPGLRILADRRFEGEESSQLAFRLLVRVPFGTALLEEIAFRGVLLGVWMPGGEFEAIAATSVAFGLWHIAPTIFGLRLNGARAWPVHLAAAVLFTALAGIVLGYLRVTTESLWAPFALHAVVNSLGSLAAVLANRTVRLIS